MVKSAELRRLVESGELRVERVNAQLSTTSWFCLRTHCRHEHIAADWLERFLRIETYAPRIRFRRLRPSGLAWFTEALFPNYLFARFELADIVQKVETAPAFGESCVLVGIVRRFRRR